MSNIKPVFLFSDSQPLFWKKDGQLFIKTLLNHVTDAEPKAAYVGYSNGNLPEFFDIFQSSMESIGIKNCHMLSEDFTDEDKNFIDEASIILLAGGDVVKGWEKIESTGLKEIILRRFSEGAVLIGVSAGAVQLGLSVAEYSDDKLIKALDTLQILPFVISAHEESDDWGNLKAQVLTKDEHAKAIGIPFGAGLIYHPDHTIEPIKSSIVEITKRDKSTVVNLLFPDDKREEACALQ